MKGAFLTFLSVILLASATNASNENFKKAISNVKHIHVLPSCGANVYDLLKYDVLILSEQAVKELEERLS